MYKDTIKQFKGLYRFLSNFYASPISYQDKSYPTAEHLYQALKTKDQGEREKIRFAVTPGEAKRKGQKIRLRSDWERIKDKLMFMIIRLKFLQNPKLEEYLFNTGDDLLIEGNYWHDNYWGDCLCPKCKQIKGRNQLGKTLMKVRRMI